MMKSASNRTAIAVALLIMACALSGCRHGGDGDCAQVRLIDGVSDAAGLSVAVNDRLVWKHSAYADSTGYQKVNAGHYQMKAQAGDMAASQNVGLGKGRRYTVVALSAPQASGIAVRVFDDDADAPVPVDKARLTLIDAAADSGQVDILVNNIVAAPDLPVGSRSAPLLVNPGDYQIKANVPDSVRTLAGPLPLHLDGGHAYTVVVMGQRAGGYVMKAFADGG